MSPAQHSLASIQNRIIPFFCIPLLFWLATAIVGAAQIYTVVADATDATAGNLVRGLDGNFYGTTINGGTYRSGTVFKVTSGGDWTTLYSFGGLATDGSYPSATLLLATDGNFYGTTTGLSSDDINTVFRITPGGALTTLYTFCAQTNCPDGYRPYAGLIEGLDGNLYGTTLEGGTHAAGTMFRITPSGKFTSLYSFCSETNCSDGGTPWTLMQATNGNFFTTTSEGGVQNAGTLVKITPSGVLTKLRDLYNSQFVVGGLIQGLDKNLYGTTFGGGANGKGTVSKFTPSGSHTTLYSFCSQSGCTDGHQPYAGLVQGTDGNFYGTTLQGGPSNLGTAFSVTPSGTLISLYSFCEAKTCADGAAPESTLIQSTDGRFYGTTVEGGSAGGGVVYRIDMGLGPFIQPVTSTGKIGQTLILLGQGLTGTAAVSFNGVPASFTVKADTYLTATVPSGATTGLITVTTPGGTFGSNVAFHVLP